MNPPRVSLILLLPLFLFLLAPISIARASPPPSNPTTTASDSSPPTNKVLTKEVDMVLEACNVTNFPEFCVMTLEAHPDSKKTDLRGLAKISIERAVDIATENSAFIDGQLNGASDATMKKRLGACSQSFKSVVNTFKTALKQFDSNSYEEASNTLLEAMEEAGKCSDQFRVPPKMSNVEILCDQVGYLSDNSMVIVSLLH